MSDRFHSLVVVLEFDIKDEDAAPIITAIETLRGVASVTGIVSDMESNMAETRALTKLRTQLFDVLYPKEKA